MNIQKLAQEYQKLEVNKYYFGIENGECIQLRFLDKNFYHLLGFHKFKEATIVKMIEDGAYYKDKFYNNVLEGNLLFDGKKIEFKNNSTYLSAGKFVHFSDVKETDGIKMVVDNRFPYFSYDNIMALFNSQLIVLYDKNKGNSWNKIDAEKIFFKFMTSEKRNLNLFIKHSKSSGCEAPVSFSLEEVINSYLLTGNQCKEKEQEKATIIYIAIQNKGNVEFSKYEIYWDRVRYKYSKRVSENYVAEKRLHDYFYEKGKGIKSYEVKVVLNQVVAELNENVNQLNEVEILLDIEILKMKYAEIPETDSNINAALELLETYGIDIQMKSSQTACSNEDIEELIGKKEVLKKKITKLNTKIKKIRSNLPKLHQLEKEEIIHVYSVFLPEINKYEDSFFDYLVDKCRVLEKNMKPRDIKELYRIYNNSTKEQHSSHQS